MNIQRTITKSPRTRVQSSVEIEPEATELLFEVEDVAELVEEVTGQDVEVAVEETGDAVTFSYADESGEVVDIRVEAEGSEEILEARKVSDPAKRVVASRGKRPRGKRPRGRVSK